MKLIITNKDGAQREFEGPHSIRVDLEDNGHLDIFIEKEDRALTIPYSANTLGKIEIVP